ncbi:hypothetical protein PCURB6_12250 [Paenibacillus curdlanolyticus]|nr:hypothetical protein PCURB6_12250 [Paenibacillus curdlanolyticus]
MVRGPVWLVVVKVSPNDFYVEDEYTIIVSDKEAVVKYIIVPNGHVFVPHEMTEEEEFGDLGDNED